MAITEDFTLHASSIDNHRALGHVDQGLIGSEIEYFPATCKITDTHPAHFRGTRSAQRAVARPLQPRALTLRERHVNERAHVQLPCQAQRAAKSSERNCRER